MARALFQGVSKAAMWVFVVSGIAYPLAATKLSGVNLQVTYFAITALVILATAVVVAGVLTSLPLKTRVPVLLGAAMMGLLALTFWALGSPLALWVPDSHSLHVPGVNRALEFFRGNESLQVTSIFGEQVQFTYLWVALIGLVAGVTPLTTAFSMIVLKVATWLIFLLYVRRTFGDRITAIALLLWVFAPTQIFYGIVFYKEPMVQFLVCAGIMAALETYRRGIGWPLLMGLLVTVCLVLERIYLAPMIGISLAIGVFAAKSGAHSRLKFALAGVAGVGVVAVFGFLFFRDFSLIKIFGNLAWMRENFMNAPGVNKEWNADIAYPLAFVKILFTPFFHPNKFEFFTDFSAILTWGAIPSQGVTLLALYGIASEFPRAKAQTAILVVPFVLFLLLFAYLAPYSGRQRDSFYPIITLFAAIGIERLTVRYQEWKATRAAALA